ncbi:MAG: hypothetical protein IT452_05165 [Planctomycetia bacterium]|nr:hypothetical protein [Planctomycetia bacterium]
MPGGPNAEEILRKLNPPALFFDYIFSHLVASALLVAIHKMPPNSTLTPEILLPEEFRALGIAGAKIELSEVGVSREPTLQEVAAAAAALLPRFLDWHQEALKRKDPVVRNLITSQVGVVAAALREEGRPLFNKELELTKPDPRKPGHTAWEKVASASLKGKPGLASAWFKLLTEQERHATAKERGVKGVMVEPPVPQEFGIYKDRSGKVGWNWAKAIGTSIAAYQKELKRAKRAVGLANANRSILAARVTKVVDALGVIEFFDAVNAVADAWATDPVKRAARTWVFGQDENGQAADNPPSVRVLAKRLGLSMKKIQRAAQELEGLLESVRRRHEE